MAKTKAEKSEYNRKYYKKNQERLRAYQMEWRKAHPYSVREWQWQNNGINLTWDEFLALLNKQNRQCAICLVQINESALADHCHVAGTVRGLLCRKCNTGLGLFNDNIETILSAARYLGHGAD